jgi:hypothetical protein|nr:hypothetical protein [uncultured Comamonas sp.]
MALSFTPQYHVQTEPGIWHKPLNPFAPFGKYPSMEEIKRVSEEAARLKAKVKKSSPWPSTPRATLGAKRARKAK